MIKESKKILLTFLRLEKKINESHLTRQLFEMLIIDSVPLSLLSRHLRSGIKIYFYAGNNKAGNLIWHSLGAVKKT